MTPSVWLTWEFHPEVPARVSMNHVNENTSFPFIEIGDQFTILPTFEQLAQLRDAIDELLKAEGKS